MAKRRFTEDNWRSDPWFQGVVAAFRSQKSSDEIADFLRDIATLSEMQAFSERLEVAKQLSRGLSYRQVAANTGASTTTVTRVAKFLENGTGAYRKMLKRDRAVEASAAQTHEPLTPTQELIERRKRSVLEKYL